MCPLAVAGEPGQPGFPGASWLSASASACLPGFSPRPNGPLQGAIQVPQHLVEDTVTCILQVQGKVRGRLEVVPGIGEDELRAMALADPAVLRALDGRDVRTVIVRAPKLVNVVPA